MNCPKCYAQLLPNTRFCGSCGLSMTNQNQQIQPQQTQFTSPFEQQSYQAPNYNQQGNYENRRRHGGGAFQFDDDGRGAKRRADFSAVF